MSGLSDHEVLMIIANQSLWLRDEEGWRIQWLLEGLSPSTNYTAYAIQNGTKVAGPIYFATKSAPFPCPLVASLPFCPGVSHAVPLPAPPTGNTIYDSTNLPTNLTSTLLTYLTNFTVTLTTHACGRDRYSPLVDCGDCQRDFRKWLCGHIIDDNGIVMDPEKVDKFANWKIPTSKDLLAGFIGSVGYLARDCPGVRVPMGYLERLKAPTTPWRWTPVAQKAFTCERDEDEPAVSFSRCGEPSVGSPSAFTVPAMPTQTGISALKSLLPPIPGMGGPNQNQGQQVVLSALLPQTTQRNPILPQMDYTQLLPCLETCTSVDRAYSPLLHFQCPTRKFNAAASYGVGYVDGADGGEGEGVAGGSQDRWGNV